VTRKFQKTAERKGSRLRRRGLKESRTGKQIFARWRCLKKKKDGMNCGCEGQGKKAWGVSLIDPKKKTEEIASTHDPGKEGKNLINKQEEKEGTSRGKGLQDLQKRGNRLPRTRKLSRKGGEENGSWNRKERKNTAYLDQGRNSYRQLYKNIQMGRPDGRKPLKSGKGQSQAWKRAFLEEPSAY